MPPVHVAVRVPGGLDLDILRRAVAELVRRHDSLRTVFRDPGVGPVLETMDVPIAVHRCGSQEEAAELAADRVRAPFDVENGPLLRVEVIELPEGCVLVVSVHHLVFDGGSATVLLRELGVLYSAIRHGASSPLPSAVPYRRRGGVGAPGVGAAPAVVGGARWRALRRRWNGCPDGPATCGCARRTRIISPSRTCASWPGRAAPRCRWSWRRPGR